MTYYEVQQINESIASTFFLMCQFGLNFALPALRPAVFFISEYEK